MNKKLLAGFMLLVILTGIVFAQDSTDPPATFEVPAALTGQIFVAEQTFENGRMFWLQFMNQIWVITNDHNGEPVWFSLPNTYVDGEPESDSLLVPPGAKFFQPKRGFGKAWRENLEVRNLLGWAISGEIGLVTDYAYHAEGMSDDEGYVALPGYHLITGLDEQTIRLNEATHTWEVSD